MASTKPIKEDPVPKIKITVHKEPKDFSGMEPEHCSQCDAPTPFWLNPHIPLCENCANAPTKATVETVQALQREVEQKRGGWTNTEVQQILGLSLIQTGKNYPGADVVQWNQAVNTLIAKFGDFSKPEEQSGAMAFNTHTRQIEHIGKPLPQ